MLSVLPKVIILQHVPSTSKVSHTMSQCTCLCLHFCPRPPPRLYPSPSLCSSLNPSVFASQAIHSHFSPSVFTSQAIHSHTPLPLRATLISSTSQLVNSPSPGPSIMNSDTINVDADLHARLLAATDEGQGTATWAILMSLGMNYPSIGAYAVRY